MRGCRRSNLEQSLEGLEEHDEGQTVALKVWRRGFGGSGRP